MATYTVNDYIPIFESKLDYIVTATYSRTRGNVSLFITSLLTFFNLHTRKLVSLQDLNKLHLSGVSVVQYVHTMALSFRLNPSFNGSR